MSEEKTDPKVTEEPGEAPEDEVRFDFDRGGVPGYLVLIYIAFLTFCAIYILDNMVPSWLDDNPKEGPAPLRWHADP